ncbi:MULTISPECIES: type II toxin-antitoxin system RelE/ParE family toxin [Pseudoalteromonas]|uniref:type II toxin-antitoxin system RelE/ParE family toxin n=1 Tax=Pseudoalteromonas TaxID=53246 RepID=UPI00158236AB|nr:MULTISPECIES: type II toxin-antitoxin system RelE/ParE family toxin [Pseudoalteromonas]MDI4653378.1 type II toxin-antitoxin system RelE/ParE family toxin [Pseudoalteromonas shioyasakiensis]NUJ39683.1 type II toxin-antitoxin system RelE/ParE family toxin [Pseudoalteromonas sp. 0303]
MAVDFKDEWLEAFYEEDKRHRLIPKVIENALYRKLEILDAAKAESDLRVPPGNRFEHLEGNLKDLCSIRVNKQYRLIFKWVDGVAENTYLDPHKY